MPTTRAELTNVTIETNPPISDLLEYATDSEREALMALSICGEMKKAAETLNLNYDTFRSRIRCVRARALKDNGINTLPGFYVKQVTTDSDGNTSVQQRPEENPQTVIPERHQLKGISQLLDGEGRELLRWNKFSQAEVDREKQFWDAAREHAREFVGIAKPLPVPHEVLSDLLAVYAIGDAHCGMLAWHEEAGRDFNLRLWQTQLETSLDLLIASTPPAKRAVILNVGDWFHVQSSDFRTPTGGNRLDGDSRLGKIVRVGLDTMRWAIDRCQQRHEVVEVHNVRGNHDPDLSVLFNIMLQAAYENNPRVVIPDNFKYFDAEEFGVNLIARTHGEGPKLADLPGILATDFPEAWGRCKRRFILTGHIHSKKIQKMQEYPGVTVESFRTLAPKDAWHTWRGYRSEQGIESLVFHRRFGLKGRSYVSLDDVSRSQ